METKSLLGNHRTSVRQKPTSSLKTIVVEQAAKLLKINSELQRLNGDLDAFAYAASHDLKEPLRGLEHYIKILEQVDGIHKEEFQGGLTGLRRLVRRMSDLLDGLLRFSRAGRSDLIVNSFSLESVVQQCKDMLFGVPGLENVVIRVEQDDQSRGFHLCS